MICGGFGFKFFVMKYKIMFSENGPVVCIAKDLSDVDAVQFAINLHRSSNVKHSIFVFEVEKVESPLLILESK